MSKYVEHLFSALQGATIREEGGDGGMHAEVTEQDISEQKEWTAVTQQCQSEASLKHTKTHKLIQHIVPIIPPNANQTRALCYQTSVVRWPARCVNRLHCGLCCVRMFAFDEPLVFNSPVGGARRDELV